MALGNLGKTLRATGLDKVLGIGILGLAGAETAKYAVINPMLERGGIKPPSYVPPPAMSQYEEIMLGRQQQPGFLGFGSQERTQGLIERRALNEMDMARNQQVMSDRIARMQIANNSPLEMTRTLAGRDRYTAQQNALASISAGMANSMVGAQSVASNIGYSPIGYPPQYGGSQPMNMGAMQIASRRMGRGGRNRYGVDMNAPDMGGMPMTPELREQMQMSPEQMGQFSGPGGSMARGHNKQRFSYIGAQQPISYEENMVPMGADEYALGAREPMQGRSRNRKNRGM